VLSAIAVGYLGVLAAWPGLRNGLPPALAWFGRPNSAVTIAVVSALLVAFAVALARSGGSTRTGAPIAVVAAPGTAQRGAGGGLVLALPGRLAPGFLHATDLDG
jgi:hypothetical protein